MWPQNSVTLERAVDFHGPGFLTKKSQGLVLEPARPGMGISVMWPQLPGQPCIRLGPGAVVAKLRRTCIVGPHPDAVLEISEHLFGALALLGLDTLRIRACGTEVPLLDGSARPFVGRLRQAGLRSIAVPRRRYKPDLAFPVSLKGAEALVQPLHGDEEPTFGYEVDYTGSRGGWQGVGRQHLRLPFSRLDDIAAARAYGLHWQGRLAYRLGFIRQNPASLGLQFNRKGVLVNPEMRQFADEEVRHKLLDLLGDLVAGLGDLPAAHITVRRGGHAFHRHLAAEIAKRSPQGG